FGLPTLALYVGRWHGRILENPEKNSKSSPLGRRKNGWPRRIVMDRGNFVQPSSTPLPDNQDWRYPMTAVVQTILADGLLTVTQSARLLNISKSKLYLMMDAGEIPYTKLGKSRRIPRKALASYVQRSMVGLSELICFPVGVS